MCSSDLLYVKYAVQIGLRARILCKLIYPFFGLYAICGRCLSKKLKAIFLSPVVLFIEISFFHVRASEAMPAAGFL